MKSSFDCMMDCPNSRRCTSASRDYPCSVYYALRKQNLSRNELEKEKRLRGKPVRYRDLKRIYESEGTK